MGYGIQSFQMSGGAGDWIKKAHQLHLLHSHVLETVTSAKYLGVDVSSGLTWNSHIDRIIGNANKTLDFLKCNIKTKMPRIRETAYNTLVTEMVNNL